MSMVLLDTVGLIALWEKTDQWHGPARQAMTALDIPTIQLVTTSLILLECGNAGAGKPYRCDVESLWHKLKANGRLIVPTESDFEGAWTEYRRGSAGDAGIVDHLSFMVMRRLNIADAFTNDHHFKLAGFNILF